jgi:hypothetical protein
MFPRFDVRFAGRAVCAGCTQHGNAVIGRRFSDRPLTVGRLPRVDAPRRTAATKRCPGNSLRPRLALLLWAALAGTAVVATADEEAAPRVIPLVADGQAAGLTAPPLAGVDVTVQHAASAAWGGTVTRLSFRKPGNERRLAALEGRPAGPVADAKALSLRCRLRSQEGTRPQLALVVFETDGGVWYRLSGTPLPANNIDQVRLPLARSLSRALFATDTDASVRWDQVDRLWIGLLLDGPTSGTFDVVGAAFTNEPFRATRPFPVRGDWTTAQDPAVKGTIAMPKEAPAGEPCLQYAFEMPGGRHMYAIPRLPVEVDELEGYSALRFSCRAQLPEGINGLLVMLIEADGTQYCADPAPRPAAQWQRFEIPFTQFRRGGWSTDENDRLDLNEVSSVAIGIHGTATPRQASGTLVVADVQFLP